ncbi:hypothetical protein DPSP01_007077 [Paraphaeosphaeria sporulosa]
MRFPEAYFVTGFVEIFFPSLAVLAAQNFDVPWSSKRYGPDGPWQAVMITLGGVNSTETIQAQNHSDIDVYPGGYWQIYSLVSAACEPFPSSICGSGGFWEPDTDDLSQLYSIAEPFVVDDPAYGLNINKSTRTYMATTIGGKIVYNSSQAFVESASMRYPSGRIGGVTLGALALGADSPNQFFSLDDHIQGNGINTSTFSGGLYLKGDIPSYSFGLHIGSAAFNYPGSLVFGGYNKGRVIDPVTSFQDVNTVDLLDIGIGVEDGKSPFSFANKSNLFLDNTGQSQRRNVTIEPLNPYLALPKKTCDGLADILPVTFDKSLDYYTWNLKDPNYEKIVTSAAYLSFTFLPPPGSSDNVIIKVPFALLNLTLSQPITDTPTQYFPCVPFDSTTKAPVLGRAFLQAAFFGRNWNTGYSWLAQAPGPGAGVSAHGLGDARTDIANDATIIEGYQNKDGSNLFNQSWAGHWSVASVPTVSNIPTVSPSVVPPPHRLSTGAKAGIGVGAAIAAIAILAAAFMLWRRRNKTGIRSSPKAEPLQSVKMPQRGYEGHAGDLPEVVGPKYANVGHASAIFEADNHHSPTEIADTNDPRMR